MSESTVKGIIFGATFAITTTLTHVVVDRIKNRKVHDHTNKLRARFEKISKR